MKADVCLDARCRWMRVRQDADPPAEHCPVCGGEVLKPPRRRPTLVELARRFDPLEDA